MELIDHCPLVFLGVDRTMRCETQWGRVPIRFIDLLTEQGQRRKEWKERFKLE